MDKQIRIDLRLDSYRSFHDVKWAVSIDTLAEGTPFERVVFDLVAAWKSIAIVREMPWLMMHSLKAALESDVPKRDPISIMIIDGLERRLSSHMGLFPMSAQQRQQLLQSLIILKEEAFHQLKANPTVIDIEKEWAGFVKIPDFALRLWKSEQSAYTAVYYSYEDFLTRCVGVVNNTSDYRYSRSKEFSTDFADSFGKHLEAVCVSAPLVKIARLVRHAIVHNGGRMTTTLKTLAPHFPIEHDGLVILAPDTTDLYNYLKLKASELISTALAKRHKVE